MVLFYFFVVTAKLGEDWLSVMVVVWVVVSVITVLFLCLLRGCSSAGASEELSVLDVVWEQAQEQVKASRRSRKRLCKKDRKNMVLFYPSNDGYS